MFSNSLKFGAEDFFLNNLYLNIMKRRQKKNARNNAVTSVAQEKILQTSSSSSSLSSISSFNIHNDFHRIHLRGDLSFSESFSSSISGSDQFPSKFLQEDTFKSDILKIHTLANLDGNQLSKIAGYLFEADEHDPALVALDLFASVGLLDNSLVRFKLLQQLKKKVDLEGFVKTDKKLFREYISKLIANLEIDRKKSVILQEFNKLIKMMDNKLLVKILHHSPELKVEQLSCLSQRELLKIRDYIFANAREQTGIILALQLMANSTIINDGSIREDQKMILQNNLGELNQFVDESMRDKFAEKADEICHWLEIYKNDAQAGQLCCQAIRLLEDQLLKHIQNQFQAFQ